MSVESLNIHPRVFNAALETRCRELGVELRVERYANNVNYGTTAGTGLTVTTDGTIRFGNGVTMDATGTTATFTYERAKKEVPLVELAYQAGKEGWAMLKVECETQTAQILATSYPALAWCFGEPAAIEKLSRTLLRDSEQACDEDEAARDAQLEQERLNLLYHEFSGTAGVIQLQDVSMPTQNWHYAQGQGTSIAGIAGCANTAPAPQPFNAGVAVATAAAPATVTPGAPVTWRSTIRKLLPKRLRRA